MVAESLEIALDVIKEVGENPVATGREGRLKLFSKCPYGKHHLADPDGVLIDVCE